jgi:hypothetical protein
LRYATDAQELYINLSKWDVKAYTQTYVSNLKHITSICANLWLDNVHERKHVFNYISADVQRQAGGEDQDLRKYGHAVC